MADEEKKSENVISDENPSPISPQELTEQGIENTAHSEPIDALPEALESPKNVDNAVLVNNANTENIPLEPTDTPLANPVSNGTSLIKSENEPNPEVEQAHSGAENEEKQAQNEPDSEPALAEPVSATAQMAGNEPLGSRAEATPPPSMSLPEKIIPVAVVVSNKNKIVELLTKAKNTIQFKKRKKLEKIMAMFLKKSKITNDEVEKLLHVSDATATRYLSQLEKEGKIKQTGKTGHAVFYVKI